MKKETGVGIILGVTALFLLPQIFKKKSGNGTTGDGQTPVDWTTGATATITYEEAADIAKKIKAAIGYFIINWDDIANQFLRLRNDKDVELLYKAFGTWDGPLYIDGDLFNALNNAKQKVNEYINPAALKKIKQYCFSYGKWLKWQ